MFDRVQILPNTLKHVETCLNSTKQGGQTEKCFAKQQCFSMFYRKTFTVWTGLNVFPARAASILFLSIFGHKVGVLKSRALFQGKELQVTRIKVTCFCLILMYQQITPLDPKSFRLRPEAGRFVRWFPIPFPVL